MTDLEFGEDFIKALPSPSNNQLINYADYDVNYWFIFLHMFLEILTFTFSQLKK